MSKKLLFALHTMSKTASVQQLLAAEKRAAEIIDAAKKARVTKLKKARSDAEAEVSTFRQKRQAAFETFAAEQETSGDSGHQAAVIQAERDIAELRASASVRKDKVADILMQLVTSVKL